MARNQKLKKTMKIIFKTEKSHALLSYGSDGMHDNKDGYRQRNVRQFLRILASPGYAPGTIAVN